MSRLARISFVFVGSLLVQLVGSACTSSGLSFTAPDAGATEPKAYVVACDQSIDLNTQTGIGNFYAEIVLPDLSTEQILSVRAAGNLNGQADKLPQAYESESVPIVIGANRAAVRCGQGKPGSATYPLQYESVTFLVP